MRYNQQIKQCRRNTYGKRIIEFIDNETGHEHDACRRQRELERLEEELQPLRREEELNELHTCTRYPFQKNMLKLKIAEITIQRQSHCMINLTTKSFRQEC